MRKKTSTTNPTKRGKTNRKLGNLLPKKVKGGDADSIKGGCCDGKHYS